jgi:putative FmdB family regulatory protein
MPLYEYECEAGHRFEKIQKFSDPPVEQCPTCGRAVHKLLSSPAFQFKGSGWYITDYARKDTKDAKEGDAVKDSKDASKSAETKDSKDSKDTTTTKEAPAAKAAESSSSSTPPSPAKDSSKP